MTPSLLLASPEILQRIALFSAGRDLGPPREWYRLLLTCRTLCHALDVPDLHTRLLEEKFCIQSHLYRRDALPPSWAKLELKRLCSTLKCFKTVDVWDSSLADRFWVAYLMLDPGNPRAAERNREHLLWAGLPGFILSFFRRRLYEGAETNNGWPHANEVNSLAIALMWHMSSQGSFHLTLDVSI